MIFTLRCLNFASTSFASLCVRHDEEHDLAGREELVDQLGDQGRLAAAGGDPDRGVGRCPPPSTVAIRTARSFAVASAGGRALIL